MPLAVTAVEGRIAAPSETTTLLAVIEVANDPVPATLALRPTGELPAGTTAPPSDVQPERAMVVPRESANVEMNTTRTHIRFPVSAKSSDVAMCAAHGS